MAHYQADGQHPPQAAHPAPAAGVAGEAGRALLRGADGRGGLLLRLLAALPPQHPVDDRRLPRVDDRRPVDHAEPPAASRGTCACTTSSTRPRCDGPTSVTGRRLVLGNGDVRISYAVAGAASPWYRNGIGDECVYVERGRARVETVFGAFEVGEGDYVIIPRATTHRWLPQRSPQGPAAHLLHRGQQPHRAAEALPQQVRPAARARAVLRARPARCRQGPLLAEDVGAQADDETEVYIKHRGGGPGAADRRHGAHAAVPPARRRRLGRLPLPLRLQRRATSSRSPAASTSRRRCTRCSRAGTSSSATSCRARSTTTRCRSRCPTTTPTSTATRSCSTSTATTRRARAPASARARSRCTRAATPHGPQPGATEGSIGVAVLRRARRHGRHVPPARARRGRTRGRRRPVRPQLAPRLRPSRSRRTPVPRLTPPHHRHPASTPPPPRHPRHSGLPATSRTCLSSSHGRGQIATTTQTCPRSRVVESGRSTRPVDKQRAGMRDSSKIAAWRRWAGWI